MSNLQCPRMWYEKVSPENAKECANNWKSWRDFGIRDSEDHEGHYIFYTSNRDSGLLDRSNEAQIKEALDAFPEEQVMPFGAKHWACGYVDGFSVLVYDSEGNLTPAFAELCKLAASLADYSILNEEHLYALEYEATLANIESEGSRLFENDPPEGWAGKVFSWLWDNDQGAVESGEYGGCPSQDQLIKALSALNLLTDDELAG